MLETAQRVVVTAQMGLSNCAAAHARSLEGTLHARLGFSVDFLSRVNLINYSHNTDLPTDKLTQ